MTVLADRLTAALTGLRGAARLSSDDVDAALRQIRLALLEADVALPVARAFLAAVRDRAAGAQLHQALDPAQQMVKIVHEELTRALGGTTRDLTAADGDGPLVLALVGLQGAGKTSTAAKLAARLVADGRSPLLVAADLTRPGAVAQLTTVAGQAGASVFAPERGAGDGDPVAVAAAARAAAAAGGHDVLIVDTAGRVTVDGALMDQARQVIAAVAPDEVLLVLDAMSGQDAATTAAAFAAALPVTGAVLTKTDGDARGGAALTVRQLAGVPIVFTATGEHVGELEVFHPDRQAGRILGMGDVLTLVEDAERAFDAEQSARLAELEVTGELTFDDFLSQLRALRKMGSLTKLVGLLPGAGDLAGSLRSALEQVGDADIARVEAIVHSMTPAERAHPELLDERRIARVAAGAGVGPAQVAALTEQLFASRQMFQDLAGDRKLPGTGRSRHSKGRGKGHGKGTGRAAKSAGKGKGRRR